MRYTQIEHILGTSIEITVLSQDPKSPEHISEAFSYFRSIDREFSRFREDSDLSQLNTRKHLSVSDRFLDLLNISIRMHHETDGLFNPLVNVAKIGYSHSFETGVFEQKDAQEDLDITHIHIHGHEVTLGENQTLDFGGIGKGYAVDGAAEVLESFGHEHFLVNAGGDIRVRGLNEEGTPWNIGIENPFAPGVFASIQLTNASVATSGNYKRQWEIAGKQYHHLLNPRSGKNEFSIQSVTVIAPECTVCDALTKSFFHQ